MNDDLLSALSADFLRTLEALGFPAFVGDLDRRIRWLNPAAIELVGDLRGRMDTSVIAPEDLQRVRTEFARKQLGAPHTEYETTIIRDDGTRLRFAVSSVPLRDGNQNMIGTFGLARAVGEPESPPSESAPQLTPRQRQTLTLLAAGSSTEQMAQFMGLSENTVRNHIKRLFRRLGACSRVEAVAKGRAAGLV